MFTYVKGSNAADYELGSIINNTSNVKGLSESPTPPGEPVGVPPGKTYHYMYSSILYLYGLGPDQVDHVETRKREGFWWLEYVYAGNTNSAGENLDYVRLVDAPPSVSFQEEAMDIYKPLTVVKTFVYEDWELADVKTDLKARTVSERDVRVDSGYVYTPVGGTPVTFSTDVAGRQMMNNYYSQAINGSQTISIYLPEGAVVLSGDQMVELFSDMMQQIDSYYDECVVQNEAIDAATNIFDAQVAAAWVYPDGPISRS